MLRGTLNYRVPLEFFFFSSATKETTSKYFNIERMRVNPTKRKREESNEDKIINELSSREENDEKTNGKRGENLLTLQDLPFDVRLIIAKTTLHFWRIFCFLFRDIAEYSRRKGVRRKLQLRLIRPNFSKPLIAQLFNHKKPCSYKPDFLYFMVIPNNGARSKLGIVGGYSINNQLNVSISF